PGGRASSSECLIAQLVSSHASILAIDGSMSSLPKALNLATMSSPVESRASAALLTSSLIASGASSLYFCSWASLGKLSCSSICLAKAQTSSGTGAVPPLPDVEPHADVTGVDSTVVGAGAGVV